MVQQAEPFFSGTTITPELLLASPSATTIVEFLPSEPDAGPPVLIMTGFSCAAAWDAAGGC